MGRASLDGCDAKVRRATTHLGDLYDAINSYNGQDPEPYEIVGKYDPDARKYEAWLEVHQEPDGVRWGLLLGDYVQNLRAALDHLAAQLGLLSGGKRISNRTQFPISESGERYWSRTKDGRPSMRDALLEGVADKYRALIDVEQPYRSGDEPQHEALAVLAWFSNVDKHQLIHPAFFGVETPGVDDFVASTTGEEGEVIQVDVEEGPLEHGTKALTITRLAADPVGQVNVQAFLTADIRFGERGNRRLGYFAKDLGIMLVRVRNVLDTFRPFF